jgi:peptidoglycan/LPS O-acetylase OafA/YrhL
VHIGILRLVFIVFRSTQDLHTWTGIALTGLSLLISIVVCELSHRILEKPLIEFAHRKFVFSDRRSHVAKADDPGIHGARLACRSSTL